MVESLIHRGDTLFQFQIKESPATAWVCLSKDDLMVVLGNNTLTAGFTGLPIKGMKLSFQRRHGLKLRS